MKLEKKMKPELVWPFFLSKLSLSLSLFCRDRIVLLGGLRMIATFHIQHTKTRNMGQGMPVICGQGGFETPGVHSSWPRFQIRLGSRRPTENIHVELSLG